MKTKADYYKLQAEIDAIAEQNGHRYALTDPCVDMEDVGLQESDDGYWDAMYASMCSSAGFSSEELGLDINKLLGRIIY